MNSNIPDILSILHLVEREDRAESLKVQLDSQNITNYIMWQGEVNRHNRKESICKGFKKIIQWAKDTMQPFVNVAEDDIVFFNPDSYKYYLSQIPDDYDVFWSMYFVGSNDENFRINSVCSGMTLFTVHSRFYDFFLNMDSDIHIDRYLTSLHEQFVFKVCPLIPVTQSGSKSDNNLMTCDYSPFLEGRKIFKNET